MDMKLNEQGLIPAIAQHIDTGEILMDGLHESRRPQAHP